MKTDFDLGETLIIFEEKQKADSKKQQSQADKLIAFAGKYKLFHDDTRESFAFINNEVIAIKSRAFRQLLAKEMWDIERKAPNTDSLYQASNIIEAMAIFDGETIKLFNRVAEHEGNFYYDLADGRVVEITSQGWRIKNNPPVLFKRYSHQQRQPEPRKGGSIERLFDYLNVKEERHRLTTLVYPISCLVPDIPHPIVHPYGDQGSGKTTMFTFYKSLIDPSKLDVIITPKDQSEVIQILEHHYLCPFDNLSSFPDWLSDLLSQACTGGGFAKRMLYTDSESVIYNFKRCIGINGISLLISKPDFMDRTILLRLERIEPNKRKEMKLLMKDFENDKPYLLGCFFDVLSKAMKIYPEIRLNVLPRMADFMRWGVAITEALGYDGNKFIEAYQSNIESQNSEIVNNNTLAQAVLIFMSDRDKWEGTVKQAYEELCKLVTVVKEDRTFPKHSNKLRKPLERIRANLLDNGIMFKIADFNNEHGVPIVFQKVANLSSASSGQNKASEDAEHPEDEIPMFGEDRCLSCMLTSAQRKLCEVKKPCPIEGLKGQEDAVLSRAHDTEHKK